MRSQGHHQFPRSGLFQRQSGCNINRVAAALDLNDVELTQLLRNNLEVSFAPEPWKTAALADFGDKAGCISRLPTGNILACEHAFDQ